MRRMYKGLLSILFSGFIFSFASLGFIHHGGYASIAVGGGIGSDQIATNNLVFGTDTIFPNPILIFDLDTRTHLGGSLALGYNFFRFFGLEVSYMYWANQDIVDINGSPPIAFSGYLVTQSLNFSAVGYFAVHKVMDLVLKFGIGPAFENLTIHDYASSLIFNASGNSEKYKADMTKFSFMWGVGFQMNATRHLSAQLMWSYLTTIRNSINNLSIATDVGTVIPGTPGNKINNVNANMYSLALIYSFKS